jgi:hypothetical protein
MSAGGFEVRQRCATRGDKGLPSVWTGRALQAGFDDLETIGLALLYPALNGALVLPAIMDIRAHPISF